MKRSAQWAGALTRYLRARRRMPFAWGSNDCGAFAAGAVAAMTGVDLSARWARATAAQAAAVLRRTGGLAAIADADLPRIDRAHVTRGDLAMVAIRGRESLGVVTEVGVAGPGRDGTVVVPMTCAVAFWRV